MKRYGLAALLVVFFAVLFAGCAGAQKTVVKKEEPAAVPAVVLPSLGKAPDFSLQDVYLSLYKLSSYQNKQPVLLFFWTTWCPFCQKELQVLNSRYPALVNDGIEVLAVNVGENIDKVQAYIKKNLYSFKVLMDRDTRATHSYSIMGVPTYIIVDTQGNIVFKENFFPEKELKALAGK